MRCPDPQERDMDSRRGKRIRKVAMVTLGCPKNEVDTGVLAGELERGGLVLVPTVEEADAILINTCGFIEDAKRESIDAILRAVELKKQGDRRVYVWGCLSERYMEEIQKEIPEVDGYFGVEPFEKIGRRLLGTSYRWHSGALVGRVLTTPPHTAYMKIAEGCDHRCTFCAIPAIKGGYRSRSIEGLVEEASALAARGVKELHLIAQDTTAYGRDREDGTDIVRLMEAISCVESIEWIRLMYAHPAHMTDALIETMAGLPNVCAYLDLPLQHVSDPLLKAMGRGMTRSSVERMIRRLRDRIPGITLRTAFLVGFPGETEAMFEELLRFIEEARFERMGAFSFSPEEGTEAFSMERAPSADTARKRFETLMETQRNIAESINRSFVGRTVRVLVDGYDEEEHRFYGRTEGDALEIDQTVWTEGRVRIGEFTEILVEGASPYDLVGFPVEERTEGA